MCTNGKRAVPASSAVLIYFHRDSSNFTLHELRILNSHVSSRLMIMSARQSFSGVIRFIPDLTTLDLGTKCTSIWCQRLKDNPNWGKSFNSSSPAGVYRKILVPAFPRPYRELSDDPTRWRSEIWIKTITRFITFVVGLGSFELYFRQRSERKVFRKIIPHSTWNKGQSILLIPGVK